MIKLILCGLWVCAATLAASYAAFSWQQPVRAKASDGDKPLAGLEAVKTRMISVPVIADGAVQGYVMVQFAFTVTESAAKRLSIKPDLILVDEAIKTIYGTDVPDFRNFKKQQLPLLSKTIVDNINKRFGTRVVEDALIQELNYVPKDCSRGAKL